MLTFDLHYVRFTDPNKPNGIMLMVKDAEHYWATDYISERDWAGPMARLLMRTYPAQFTDEKVTVSMLQNHHAMATMRGRNTANHSYPLMASGLEKGERVQDAGTVLKFTMGRDVNAKGTKPVRIT